MTAGGRRGSSADRAQLSLTLVEAGVGALLILALAAGFGLTDPLSDHRTDTLDRHAADALTLLDRDRPVADGPSRLSAASRSAASFDRERPALDDRLDDLLSTGLRYRLRTPQGSLGDPLPTETPTGRAVLGTRHGDVVLWVWYA